MDLRDIKITPGILALILGGLGLVVMLFLIINQLGALNDAQDRVSEESDALNLANIRLGQLVELRQRGPEFVNYWETLEQLIPAEAGEADLIISLDRMARNAGIELTEVRFDERGHTDEYVEVPLQISFRGEFRSFLEIIQNLQEGNRAFRIENINLDGERLDLNLKAFYRDFDDLEEN